MIRQRKPIKRGAPPKRGKRPKRVNTKRKAKNWTRAYGGKARIAFVAAMPCLVNLLCDRSQQCHNAHITTGGMGRKSDAARIVPLCSWHHDALHRRGRLSFEQFFGLDLAAEAARIDALWLASLAGPRTPPDA